MNILAHAFFGYFLISLMIPDAKMYIWPIFLFSILPDIDHIPGIFRELTLTKKEKKKITPAKNAFWVRSDAQEPIGILMVIILLFGLYVFGVNHILLFIAGVAFIIHWLIDFLTVYTAPMAPLKDRKLINFFFKGENHRHNVMKQVILTVISLILFLISYFYL